MCHCYGKITVELVLMRTQVTLPIRGKPLSQWEMRILTYYPLALGTNSPNSSFERHSQPAEARTGESTGLLVRRGLHAQWTRRTEAGLSVLFLAKIEIVPNERWAALPADLRFPREAHAPEERLKSRVGAQIVKSRIRIERKGDFQRSFLVRFFQEKKRVFLIAQSCVDGGDHVRRNIPVF